MAKKLVFVWSDPKVRVNMNNVMVQRNFAPANTSQLVMFLQPKYRNKVDNELLVLGVNIDAKGAGDVSRMKAECPSLTYIAVDIQGVSQEEYHEWSERLLAVFPDLMFFDPLVGGKVFDKMRGELHA